MHNGVLYKNSKLFKVPDQLKPVSCTAYIQTINGKMGRFTKWIIPNKVIKMLNHCCYFPLMCTHHACTMYNNVICTITYILYILYVKLHSANYCQWYKSSSTLDILKWVAFTAFDLHGVKKKHPENRKNFFFKYGT